MFIDINVNFCYQCRMKGNITTSLLTMNAAFKHNVHQPKLDLSEGKKKMVLQLTHFNQMCLMLR